MPHFHSAKVDSITLTPLRHSQQRKQVTNVIAC